MGPDDKPVRDLKAADIAAAFGLKRRCALNWTKAGCPHDDLGMGRGKGKRFNLIEVRRWIAETGRRLSRGGGPDTLSDADFMAKKRPTAKVAKKKRKSRKKRTPEPRNLPIAIEIDETAGAHPETAGAHPETPLPADAGAHEEDTEFDFLEHKQQLSLAKLRKEIAMAQRYELDVEIKKANLIPREEVERTRLERVAYARARMIGGPSILAPDLAHASLQTVEHQLDEWVAQILADLAGVGETDGS